MKEDRQLLVDFCRNESESAFAELVSRYLDLVYSTALRIVGGDQSLAEDVSQSVFLHLARRAASLNGDVRLAGWIHRHTCFTAAKLVRTERRRKRRERIALERQENETADRCPWDLIAPHLDDCLNELKSADRESLILRFLNRLDLREVGNVLGVSEDAAQKRVSRALERLRTILKRRGFTGSSLSSLLITHAVTEVPLKLAASVVANSTGVDTGVVAAKTLFDLIPAMKMNIAMASVVIVGMVSPILIHYRVEGRLLVQEDALNDQASLLASLEPVRSVSNQMGQVHPEELSGEELSKLMNLRNRVGRMRRRVIALEWELRQSPEKRYRIEVLAAMERYYESRVNALKERFATMPSKSIPELQLLTDRDWRFLVGEQTGLDEPSLERLMSKARTMAASEFGNRVLKPALDQFASEHLGAFPTEIEQLTVYFSEPVPFRISDRWKIIQTSHFAPVLRRQVAEDDWVLTQRRPINAALDQRYVLGLKGRHLFSDGPAEFWNDLPGD